MKKVTYNAHPKLIQKGFQEKVKQTKEKIIGNQDSADCFKKALKFEFWDETRKKIFGIVANDFSYLASKIIDVRNQLRSSNKHFSILVLKYVNLKAKKTYRFTCFWLIWCH